MTLKYLLDIKGSDLVTTSLGQMLVIEAKSFKEVLAKHISQVIAQCIAMYVFYLSYFLVFIEPVLSLRLQA